LATPRCAGTGSGTGSSNSCSKPKRLAILGSHSHPSAQSSAISCTLPRCLLRARASIKFRNWNSLSVRSPPLAKGEAKIADDTSLPLIDRIAICAGGREAQSVFGAPANHLAGAMDEAKIIKLTKHLHEEARSAPLNDGYQRAHELIVAHKAKVDRIAEKSGSHRVTQSGRDPCFIKLPS